MKPGIKIGGIAIGAAIMGIAAASSPYLAQAQSGASGADWDFEAARPVSTATPSAGWLFNKRTGEVWFCQAGPPQCGRTARLPAQ